MLTLILRLQAYRLGWQNNMVEEGLLDEYTSLDIKAKHSGGISAGDLRQRCLIHSAYPGDMPDRIIFAHIERVVSTHHDSVRTEDVDQICQLVIGEDHRIQIDLPQIGRWWQWQIAMRILPRAPGVIDPAGITGKIATAMHGHQLQIGEARQRSGKDQVVKRERGIERIS